MGRRDVAKEEVEPRACGSGSWSREVESRETMEVATAPPVGLEEDLSRCSLGWTPMVKPRFLQKTLSGLVISAGATRMETLGSSCHTYSLVKERGDINTRMQPKPLCDGYLCRVSRTQRKSEHVWVGGC